MLGGPFLHDLDVEQPGTHPASHEEGWEDAMTIHRTFKPALISTLVMAALALCAGDAAAGPWGRRASKVHHGSGLGARARALRSSLRFVGQDLRAAWRRLRRDNRGGASEGRILKASRLGWSAEAVRRLQSWVEIELSVNTRVRGPGLKETVRLEMDPRHGRLRQPPRLAGQIVDAILDGYRVRITSPRFRPYEITTLKGLKLWADTVRTESLQFREARRLQSRGAVPNRWKPDRWTQWSIPRPRGTLPRDGEGAIGPVMGD
jgi:hypothetical protein